MRRMLQRVNWIAFIAILCFMLLSVPCFAAGTGDGTGGGGGENIPTLQGSPAVSNVTETSAVVVFKYTNNIGSDEGYNRQFFYAQDQDGNPVSYTLTFWPNPSDARRRECEMRITGLTPGTTYTAGVRAGVRAKNGQVSPSSASKRFTTKGSAATPVPTPTATAVATSKPTSVATAVPRRTPASQPTPSEDFSSWVDEEGNTQEGEVTANEPGSGGGTGGGKAKPLELDYSQPAFDEKNLPTDTQFKLHFTKNVVYLAARENNKKAITLWEGDTQVEAEIYMVDDQLNFEERNFVTVIPKKPLKEATEYTIKVDDTLTAKSGAKLEKPVEVHYYTVGYQAFPVGGYVAIGAAIAALAAVIWIVMKKKRKEKTKAGV